MRAAGRQAPSATPEDLGLRVLIIDDSVVARAVFSRLLGDQPDITVAGQAASAAEAIYLLGGMTVDVILLDLEMPGMSGLDALPELIRHGGSARVLIVSSICADGAAAAVKALRLGAADTLAKPGAHAFAGRFGDELVTRLRRLGGAARPSPPALTVGPGTDAAPPPARAEMVGIAASTGGVHALAALLGALPRGFTLPILITQHLPALFMPFFATQLEEMSGRRTRLAETGMQPAAGEMLLAPGDAHLTLVRTGRLVHVRLAKGRAPSGCLPSADPMLASVAALYGGGGVAVVLSGMGRDGATGAAALAAAGGDVLAQDMASSVVWGMPGAVARAGVARAVAPPVQLAAMLGALQDWRTR